MTTTTQVHAYCVRHVKIRKTMCQKIDKKGQVHVSYTHLQDINDDNRWHNLQVIHILISIEHLTQFLCIFNVPWQFDVLSLRSEIAIMVILSPSSLGKSQIHEWKLTHPIWETLNTHKTLHINWLKRCQSIWKWIFSPHICHCWTLIHLKVVFPCSQCHLHWLCCYYNYYYRCHYRYHCVLSQSGYL